MTCATLFGIDQADVEITGGSEVTLVGEIGSFADENRVDRLGHEPVEVGIAPPLAWVRMLIGMSSTQRAMSVPWSTL
jgi:hypothetical protein